MMAKVVRHPPGKERPHNAPMTTLPLRRAGARVLSFFRCHWHRLMISLEARRGRTRPRKWRRWGSYTNTMRVFWLVVSLAVLAWIAEGLYILITGETTAFETWRKGNAGFDALIRFVGPVLTAGIATALFLFLWYGWTKRRFLKKARKKPNELVLTAGPHISEVVGRREVAQVIAQRLRERSTRRPYLLVGGVGVGKTAVLVQLTEILAREHAVPVPIRLRDAAHESDLNFEEMAKRRFSEEAPQGILARSKNDRVWNQLLADDKPVVIADGLEEAILDESLQDDRDNVICRAIERAYQEKLPLVIASRPHAPLEGTNAAIIELEPSVRKRRSSSWRQTLPRVTNAAWTGSWRRRRSPNRRSTCRSHGSCIATTAWNVTGPGLIPSGWTRAVGTGPPCGCGCWRRGTTLWRRAGWRRVSHWNRRSAATRSRWSRRWRASACSRTSWRSLSRICWARTFTPA